MTRPVQIFNKEFNKKIKEELSVNFSIPSDGLYLIKVDARCSAWWDKFPRILRKFFSDDELEVVSGTQTIKWNGNDLIGLRQTGIFINKLLQGEHKILLVPKRTPYIESVSVFEVEGKGINLDEIVDVAPEDGERRPYLFVRIDETVKLENLILRAITLEGKRHAVFKRDDDNLKIIINGDVIKNGLPRSHSFWYWCGRVQKGDSRELVYKPGSRVYVIDLFADRTPRIEKFELQFKPTRTTPKDEKEVIREKIRAKAKDLGVDPELMVELAECESSLNPKAISAKDARGLFQLTPIAIQDIKERFGFEVTNPFDIDQNIHGGILFYRWNAEKFKGADDALRKTLLAWYAGRGTVSRDEPFEINGFKEKDRHAITVLIRCVLGEDAI